LHRLVGHPPVAAVSVVVVRPVLQKDADGLRLVLADERVVAVAAAQADISADRAEDAGEGVGALPGSRERGNRAARRAADGVVVAALREADRAPVGSLLRSCG